MLTEHLSVGCASEVIGTVADGFEFERMSDYMFDRLGLPGDEFKC